MADMVSRGLMLDRIGVVQSAADRTFQQVRAGVAAHVTEAGGIDTVQHSAHGLT